MTLPTDSQWARYSVLCAHLRPFPPAARQAQLAAWQGTGAADPQVLSLVALHYALPPDPDRDRTGERLGPFTLEAPLGAGGMGIVYRAQQHIGLTTRPVAVKLIHPTLLRTAREEALARFQAEMGTLVKLEHEGIARIYDGGIGEDPRTHEPLPYLAMELVRGGLPITTYAQDYALPWPERLTLFVRVCQAVRYAHEHRVVHCDLKPTNILVDSDGRPVVIDFGLASACDALLPGAPLVASGTPAYMSPEQVAPAWGAVSDRSDVYALGLILYELLTGQRPYVLPRDGAFKQWQQVITEAAPLPLRRFDATYGEELEVILAAALAKQPAERLSVAVLRARLERYLQTQAPARSQRRQDTSQRQRDQTGTTPRGLVPGSRTPEAERRQLTILFCDLVASTALATQLDPEDLREVIRAYHAACAEVIQRFGGYIAQYLGDGLLVYFGYPQAHEDAAQRAVRTGLGLVAVMGPLNTRLEPAYGIRVAVRVGIHTGLVVVGEIGGSGRQEQLALGETPNIAARLQGLAAPDTVVISEATARLVEGYFVCQPFRAQALKGITTPVPVCQVLQESGAQTRLDVVPPRGLAPLVGRDDEVALLQRRWDQATRGQGQVVLLSGEPGIGKSRLVQVLKDNVATAPHTRIEWRGSPDHQQSALYPVIDQLYRRLRWRPDAPPSERLRTLEAALAASGVVLSEAVPLLAALLSLPLPASYPPLTLTPPRQRQQTLDILLAWLHADVQRQPVLLIVEDLHWVDPSTLELLSLLVDQSAERRLCLVLTTRPEFHPPWPMGAHLSVLTLRRLAPAQIEGVTTHVAGGKALPPVVLQEVVRMTDGVPLFVEELTKTILGSGLLEEHEDGYTLPGPLPPLAIPATLHDALMARLDRLASSKAVAQLGAVLGRTFPYAVLQAVSPWEETALQHGLRQLVEAELVYQRGVPPQATYTFKHALIQETAYQSLLTSIRRQYHQQIAQVVEARFPETVAAHPVLLAQHYTAAGCPAQAIPYWQRAGQQAIERASYVEAANLLAKGLALVAALPDTLARARQELQMQMVLCRALRVTQGIAAPEVEATYHRARELCQQVGETGQLLEVLGGLVPCYTRRGDLETARELVEQMRRLAQQVQDPAGVKHAYLLLGRALAFCGDAGGIDADTIQTYLGQAFTLFMPEQLRVPGPLNLIPLGVFGFARLATDLWSLGYPDQALQRSHAALTLARERAQPVRVAALIFAAMLHGLRREAQLTYEHAAAAFLLAREQGCVERMAEATILRGWARVQQGQGEVGIAHIRQVLAARRAIEARMSGWYRVLLVEACRHVGQVEEGLHVIAQGLASKRSRAELVRLKGELLLTRSAEHQAEAETCFLQALTLTHRQQAKSWELRTAMSLARLWQQQGKRAEAYDLLAPVYNWFTEGFDTADLQEAKALLDALA